MSAPARPVLAATTLLVVALLTTACGSTPGSGGAQDAGPSATPTASPSTPQPSPSATLPAGGGLIPADARDRPQVKAAIEAAATLQKVTPDEVVIASFTPVTWNDGSLGCPKKDMSYTMATVEGELLILRVGMALLQYHGRVGGPYTYCPDPSAGYSVGG
ncbi:hypothetical protein [Oryzobacter telluris]|uniref:hypothetical protein n=1 Tax=Oryzobacter telluris TaxID=3149179 RepID=UPI00370D23D9